MSVRAKGQPLLVLVALLAGWIGGRAMNWESLTASATPGRLEGHGPSSGNGELAYALVRGPQSYQDVAFDPAPTGMVPGNARAVGNVAMGAEAGSLMVPVAYRMRGQPRMCAECAVTFAPTAAYPFPRGYMAMPADEEWGESARVFASALSAGRRGSRYKSDEAGLTVMPRREYPSVEPLLGLPPQASGTFSETNGSVEASQQPAAKLRRWSLDAWAFMRRDGNLKLANGLLPATYGANQIGSVLRFRLIPRSRLQPTLYLRTDSTTGEGRYATVAAGASVRPLEQVPVAVALEGRMLDDSAGRHYQPAALAVTQLPSFHLPYGLTGEAYAQGGWVGGRYATPFADGQLRIDHGLLAWGRAEARIGAGGWGGVQKGASRLDVGPTMAISFPLTRRVFGRASLDWRMRALGDAHPGSGPALTLSAGF